MKVPCQEHATFGMEHEMPDSSVANPPEEWRRAPTRCGRFEVSADGRVRNRFNERELSFTTVNGYLGFATRKTRQDRAYAYKVHRLVLLAFGDPRPSERHVVNHKDGDKLNNRIDNLEWATPSENAQHAVRLGLMQPKRGMDNTGAKLTDEVVRYVRRVYQPHSPRFGARALGERLGVCHSTISRIANRKAWRHVEAQQ